MPSKSQARPQTGGAGGSKSGGSASTGKSSPKSKSGSSTTKKLSSLSSFQPKLNFTLPSSSKPSTSPIPRPKSVSPTKDDRELMPPPPLGLMTKSKALAAGVSKPLSRRAPRRSQLFPSKDGDRKGKGKEIVIDDNDDDDDITVTGSRSGSKTRGPRDMWTESYAPVSESDLAPSKSRINDVKDWIHTALYGFPPGRDLSAFMSVDAVAKIRKYRRILLLSGPAGAGKTTTVRVLAREMGIELLEWGEGADDASVGSGLDRESASAKLISFLSRHSYSPLTMGSVTSSSTSRPRMILLTGLPNLSHLPTREAFHAALLSFCQNFTDASCPMVVVHSGAGSGGRAEESWQDRDRGGREGSLELLGKAVKEGPWSQTIDFLPVAPTFVTKALDRIIKLANESTLDWLPPQPARQLIALSCNGDLRSAVNSLQMLCNISKSEQTSKSQWSASDNDPTRGKRKRGTSGGQGSRGGKGAKLNVSESLRAVLDAVMRKEQNLNLFHSLGKVLYNKRLGDPGEDTEDQELLSIIRRLPQEDALPDHLRQFERRKSLIQLEAFLTTIPVDASSFALWLHENMPRFVTAIDEASAAIEDLCRADIMKADDDIWQSSPQAIAYALHLTVRGVLMALPSPVPRLSQKIVKPNFFESFRTERDNSSNLDIATAYIAKKAVTSSNVLAEKPLDVESDQAAWGGLLPRSTLVTEMIPMMIKIQTASKRPLLPSSVQPLQLPRYTTSSFAQTGMIIDDRSDMTGDDDFEESTAGEDGMGVPTQQAGVWDDMPEVAEKEEDDEGLQGDDIEDWD